MGQPPLHPSVSSLPLEQQANQTGKGRIMGIAESYLLLGKGLVVVCSAVFTVHMMGIVRLDDDKAPYQVPSSRLVRPLGRAIGRCVHCRGNPADW